MIIGIFSGQMLVGFISSAYSWEYFYYLCSGNLISPGRVNVINVGCSCNNDN